MSRSRENVGVGGKKMGESPEEGNDVEYWRNYRKPEWLNQVSEGA